MGNIHYPEKTDEGQK